MTSLGTAVLQYTCALRFFKQNLKTYRTSNWRQSRFNLQTGLYRELSPSTRSVHAFKTVGLQWHSLLVTWKINYAR